jgi:hypothetical protein
MNASKTKPGRTRPEAKKSLLSRRNMLIGIVGAAGGAAVIGGATGVFSSNAQPAGAGAVTLYKNPQCDCCEDYAAYLRKNGFAVKVISTNDLTVMGEKYGIPASQDPCHISLIAGYVVGGHIPFEVVKRLLSEKPQITGINLPGMPTGTPGMSGPKVPLTIYEIGKGSPKVYATV